MSVEMDPCEVCKKEQAKSLPADFDGVFQDCPRCGRFKLAGTAVGLLHHGVGESKRTLLSGWIRDQNNSGSVPMISSLVLENVFQRPIPPVAERAYSLLRESAKGLSALGAHINTKEPRFLAATYSADYVDVNFLGKALQDEGLMAFRGMGSYFEILPKGYMKLDELRRIPSASAQGFIAMWFDESLNAVYTDGFQSGVLTAGYNPMRIDRFEHVNRIDDEIIRQINASLFVVADFTAHRGGVYFEAGYALGKGIPVFWTCRNSDMADLHFDIRQFNCINWETPDELSTRLSARIEAVLGPGPSKSTLGRTQ